MKRFGYILLSIFLCIPHVVFATAFSMGSGASWVEMCTGSDKNYPGNVGKELCFTTMLSYQVGAVTQAKELGEKPTLCSKIIKKSMVKNFVNYIKAKKERLQEDFLELYPMYLKDLNECKI